MLVFMFNLIILIVLLLMAASLFVQITGLQYWVGALFLGILGLLFHFGNVYLSFYYIKKNAPGVLEFDSIYGKPMEDGEYLWEKTSATGVVPKWISYIGFIPYASVIAIIIWLIKWFI